VNFHYPCVYRHPYYQKIGYQKTYCPAAEIYQVSALTLPLYPSLSEGKVNYIVKNIESFFKKNIKIRN